MATTTPQTRKYIILFGKFGRHDSYDKAKRLLGPLVISRPGDIMDLTVEQAYEKGTAVRLATDDEVAAYEERQRTGTQAPIPVVQQDKTLPGGPIGSTDGIRLGEPTAPAGKPAPQPVAPAATAQAPAPAAPAPAAPVVPAAAPAAPPAVAPAAPKDKTPKPKARGKKKSANK